MTGEHTSETTRLLAEAFPVSAPKLPVAIVGVGATADVCPGCAICRPTNELNDALAAKVAHWKARAEKAEAALKAAEDDRHLTTPMTTLIPDIIEEPAERGCATGNETIGYMAAEISRLRSIENQFADKCDLLDWAESLLCNAVPMPHCTQEDWDAVIKKWRDRKNSKPAPPTPRA